MVKFDMIEVEMVDD